MLKFLLYVLAMLFNLELFLGGQHHRYLFVQPQQLLFAVEEGFLLLLYSISHVNQFHIGSLEYLLKLLLPGSYRFYLTACLLLCLFLYSLKFVLQNFILRL